MLHNHEWIRGALINIVHINKQYNKTVYTFVRLRPGGSGWDPVVRLRPRVIFTDTWIASLKLKFSVLLSYSSRRGQFQHWHQIIWYFKIYFSNLFLKFYIFLIFYILKMATKKKKVHASRFLPVNQRFVSIRKQHK